MHTGIWFDWTCTPDYNESTMELTRFPRLSGVAGWWVAVVVLLGGCSSLTSAPPPFFGGGSDAATLDGAGPADAGQGSDGVGGSRTDSVSDLAVDMQLVDTVAQFGQDTAGPAASTRLVASVGRRGRGAAEARRAWRATPRRRHRRPAFLPTMAVLAKRTVCFSSTSRLATRELSLWLTAPALTSWPRWRTLAGEDADRAARRSEHFRRHERSLHGQCGRRPEHLPWLAGHA